MHTTQLNANLSRRDMLKLSATALLGAGLWPGLLRAGDAPDTGDFSFLVANDLHYVDAKSDDFFARAVRQMRSADPKPEFCLLAGDLAQDGTRQQLAPLLDHLKALDLPLRTVPGNHDYVAQNDRKAYDELFKDSLNYHFTHRGWQFVALDSTDGQRASDTSILPEPLKWLDDQLPKLSKERPTVVFTHFPLGPLVVYRPKNADDLLGRFKEYNLQAAFCGHFHSFTERQVGKSIVTTNKCCSFARANHDGTREKGYFLVTAKAGELTRQFVEVKMA